MLGVAVTIILIILLGSGAIGSGPFLIGVFAGFGLIILWYLKDANDPHRKEKDDAIRQQLFEEEIAKIRQNNLYRGCERYTPPKKEDDKK